MLWDNAIPDTAVLNDLEKNVKAVPIAPYSQLYSSTFLILTLLKFLTVHRCVFGFLISVPFFMVHVSFDQ